MLCNVEFMYIKVDGHISLGNAFINYIHTCTCTNFVTNYYFFYFQAKIMCSSSCKCVGCKNFEESPERKTLMHLADAAEVRVQQQTAAKSKLSSQISGIPSRRPQVTSTGER